MGLRRAYEFLFKEESIPSYIAFFALSFIVLKFVIYPGFLFLMGWRDIVAVLSPSMEHGDGVEYTYYQWFSERNVSVEDFPFPHGLNVGDAVIVVPPRDVEVGDVIVFYPRNSSYSLVHRVVEVDCREECYYTTKGDANLEILPMERNITEEQIVGKAVFRVPLLGLPRTLMFYLLGI
ncbi:MAG TPA: signal peptidase I [Candidatus Aenigmarchaeota archaeon]|nr:signal peptidase I [Candidatus Aenigmarchaeota archaeon]